MGLRYYYRDNNGDIQEIAGAVRRMTLSSAASAEEGSVGTFELTVDDPEATFDIRGHRLVYIVEDSALGDDYAGMVWVGYTGDRDVFRGEYRAGSTGRQWKLHLHDVNTLLDRRINVGNDCDRPAETDLARIDWLMGTAELGNYITDSTTYIDSTGAVNMDAVDYRGQKVIDVIDDCAQQSGRNYFLFWQDDPTDLYLWYKHAAASNYTTPYRISNVLADVDSSTIFAPDHETTLTRSPSRVYSGVYQQYDGGAVYVTKAVTGERFAKRDTPGRAENVKTEGTARRRALRYLDDIDTELDTIATSVIVDGGRINGIMQGHRILVKYSHLPGYDDEYKPMRVRDRSVHEIAPDTYELALNLTGPSLEQIDAGEGGGGAGGPGTIYAILSGASGPYPLPSGRLLWDKSGDTMGPQFVTSGPFSMVSSGVSWPPYYGIEMTDTGVINAVMTASAIGIMWGQRTPYTVTWELMLDDAVAAAETIVAGPPPTGTDLASWGSWGPVVQVENLAVSSGQVLWGRLSCVGSDGVEMAMFRSPLGVNPGVNNNRIEITGGTF